MNYIARLVVFFCPLLVISAQVPSTSTGKPGETTGSGTTGSRLKRAPDKKVLEQKWPTQPEPEVAGVDKPDARRLFDEARALIAGGKPEEAIIRLRSAEKLVPERFEIPALMGIAFERLRKTDDAVASLRRAVQLDQKNASVRYTLCRILGNAGRYVDAAVECREAVRLEPAQMRFRVELANIYLLEAREAEAIGLLESVEKRPVDDTLYWGTLGDAYLLSTDYQRALEVYEQIARTRPMLSVTYQRLSVTFDFLNRPADAIAQARKFVELEPRLLASHVNLCHKLGAGGFFDDSIEACKKALAIAPAAGDAHLLMSEAYSITGDSDGRVSSLKKAYLYLPKTPELAYHVGKAFAENGEHAEAVEALEYANSAVPNRPEIMRALGMEYIEVGRFEEGIAFVERANELSPLPPGFSIDLTRVKNRQQMLSKFDELVENAKRNPNDIRARVSLGNAYVFKRMFSEAEQEFLAIIKLRPNDYRDYNGLAILYIDNKQYEKAVGALRKAIELNQNHVLNMSLSFALEKLGRTDEALSASRRAVEIKPDSGETHLAYADLLQKVGKREDAARELRAAADLLPNDTRPLFRLAWLYVRMGNKQGAISQYSLLKALRPDLVDGLGLAIKAHFGQIP